MTRHFPSCRDRARDGMTVAFDGHEFAHAFARARAMGTLTDDPMDDANVAPFVGHRAKKPTNERGKHRATTSEHWTLANELASYEAYVKNAGCFDRTFKAMERTGANGGRARARVRSWFQNAGRRLNEVILKKEFGVEIEMKNPNEMCAALEVYGKFRKRESGGEENAIVFGRRLASEPGLRKRCAEELFDRLHPLISRDEWRAVKAMREGLSGHELKAAHVGVTEGMPETEACVFVDGKPRFVLQLYPKDEQTERSMHANQYKPLMELTFKQTKSISGLIAHLSEKWLKAAPSAGHLLQLYACENAKGSSHLVWNATRFDGTAMDIYKSLGSPKCFRLRYGWTDQVAARLDVQSAAPAPPSVQNLSSLTFDAIPRSAIPGDTPVRSVAKKRAKEPLNFVSDFTLSDLNGSGLTNLFGVDTATRQPLASVNSPTKPQVHRPGPGLWSSPRKKGEPLPPSEASLLRVLDGIGASDDIGVGAPGDTLGNMGDSMFEGSMGFGTLFGGDLTRSRAAGAKRTNAGAVKGPTNFSGIFDRIERL